jgi:hypothetical protein
MGMTSHNRPVAASALVAWVACHVIADQALVGDLLEERNRGRGALWFWRQLSIAAAIEGVRLVREHKILTLRAIVMGSAVIWIGTALGGARVSPWIRGLVLQQLVAAASSQGFTPPTLPHLWGLWTLDLLAYVPMTAVYVLAGWTVGRLHRAHGALIVAFALVVLLRAFIQSTARAAAPVAVNPVLFVTVWTLLPTFSVMLGGTWGLGSQIRSASRS